MFLWQGMVREVNLIEQKELVPTSFGPEETEHVVMQHRMKDRKIKESQKEALTRQMEVSETPVPSTTACVSPLEQESLGRHAEEKYD